MAAPWILVGLGNPGGHYARNRHNIGFLAVDEIARRYNFTPFRPSKFQGDLSEGSLDGVKCLLVKPTTYMNLSGDCVGAIMRFFKVPPEQVIVFHDELELPASKFRVKRGGGHAGHNGLKSLDAHCTPEYWRVRLGIGHPGDKARVTAHVLSDFAKADEAWLSPLLDAVTDAIPLFVTKSEREFTESVSRKLTPPKPPKPAPVPPRAAAAEGGTP
jgi:PTH1 family peptidyl-tRNA hydrolase